MKGRNPSQKVAGQQLIKIVDDWILKLKKRHDFTGVQELDLLPANAFLKVIDHQEFGTILGLVGVIHLHETVLFDCLHRKYFELSAVDRNEAIDAIHARMNHADVSAADKYSWRELLHVLVPVRLKKAA